ncbi:MAG: gamma carbonic anhydrase family protein [Verrucomicrobia bacterium]|nr:gamma carbonic anhydrase family protein [Verrucomicrobiota bacterium]MBI3867859.1 gamma carbonic anhydrase family protein [Verrucomicrobiota bacterium]
MKTVADRLDQFLRQTPALGKDVFVARGAVVIGAVTLGDGASVWYNAVLRGDIERIVVGRGTNIQDNAVVHLADDLPCVIGDHVTVGHSAIVHACAIGNECLIGMGATVLDGAVIGDQCVIGAQSLVPPGKNIPAGSLVMGVPGKIVRQLSDEERQGLRAWAEKYVQNAAYCLKHRIGTA